MNHTITKLPQSQAQIEVTLPFSEFERHVKHAAAVISERIEIEGFRKGKAPYDVVKNRVGEGAIYEEAAELAVRVTYPELIAEIYAQAQEQKQDFAPIGRPEITITKLAPGNELTYKIIVALLPSVTLPDYTAIARKIRTQKQETPVTEQELDTAVRWLQEGRIQLVTVERKAAAGDRVEVDFEIRHGGVKIEGGESKNHPLVIGEGRFLPGFEDQLAGLAAGETKEFSIVAPEDWRNKQFAGKALDFSVTMRLVQERTVPEMNDEFARGLGDFASVEALRQTVREGLLQEKKEKETQRLRSLIIREVADKAVIDVPDVLVSSEIEKMLQEISASVTHMGMQWEDYLAQIQKTPEQLRKECADEAGKRVRVALSLGEIATREHIEPAEEEVAERANQFLTEYRSSQQAEKKIDPDQLHEYSRGILKNEKVFEFLENMP